MRELSTNGNTKLIDTSDFMFDDILKNNTEKEMKSQSNITGNGEKLHMMRDGREIVKTVSDDGISFERVYIWSYKKQYIEETFI